MGVINPIIWLNFSFKGQQETIEILQSIDTNAIFGNSS